MIKGDRIFLILVLALIVIGFAIFGSASLGLLARDAGDPSRLLFTQLAFGLVPGLIALTLLRFLPERALEYSVIPLYILTLVLTLSVFIPGVGETLNGATRWINVFGITTLQPAEFLKIGVILLLASYLAHAQKRLASLVHGFLPFLLIIGIPVLVLLLQPNTSTAIIVAGVGIIMYIIAGAPWKHTLLLFGMGLLLLGGLLFMRPYLMDRVMTFINPASDPLATGYQLQQSLIAVGSGELTGRGFGQSVQKFNYLPEPVGDSIFAVYAEEFGFVGAVALVLLFFFFALRGLKIAGEASTRFGMLAATGLTLLIVLSAFFNMGAMLGIVPLSGLPLPFTSHGGSALLATLATVGIILHIAANKRRA